MNSHKNASAGSPPTLVAAVPATLSTAPRTTPGAPAAASATANLTKDQLLALIPGAAIERTSTLGVVSRWSIDSDGSLVARWVGTGRRHLPQSADGHWMISEDGHLCVHIAWPFGTEHWCRRLTRLADGQYQTTSDPIGGEQFVPPADRSSWRPLKITR